jgi:ABC-type glycerol-3-phosphate transport system permease component
MIVPDTAFALPVAVWLLTAYLRAFPDEIEDAARVDGASSLQLLVKIVTPMAAGGIAAAGAVAFLLSWNEFLFANIFTFDETARPVTVLLSQFVQPLTFAYGPAAAASLIVALPLAATSPILYRRFVVRDR